MLDDRALDLGDRDLDHHLVAAPDRDRVDDLVGAARQPSGEIDGLLRLDRVRGGAGQHDAVADAVDLDVGVGQRLPERGAHAVEVALDGDVIGGDLLAGGIEEHDVGLADRRADDVGALRRADDGVGDLRIGDQHVLDVARQVEHDGLSDAERQEARIHLPVGGNRCGAVVACHHRRHGRVERQGGNGRKRQSADDEGPHHRLISPALHLVRSFGHFCTVLWLATP